MLTTLRKKIQRPLANAHWSVLLFLVLGWDLILLSRPCKEPPFYLETVFATSSVFLAAWISSLRAPHSTGWRRALSTITVAMYDLLKLALIIVMIALPISIFLPTYQCYTSRAKLSELVLSASQNRIEIEKRFDSQQTLRDVGKGLEIPLAGRVAGGLITPDGAVVVMGEDPPAVVMLTPRVEGDKLRWTCLAFPKKAAPMTCR